MQWRATVRPLKVSTLLHVAILNVKHKKAGALMPRCNELNNYELSSTL